MSEYVSIIEALIWSFLVTLVLSPFVIALIKREKVKQTILEYVEAHSSKAGTPTMGGIIFLISISVVSYICFSGASMLAKLSLLVFLAYGLVGFLDDFLKFKFKRNLGLRAYQKIIFQVIISISVAVFAYSCDLLGGEILLPFSKRVIDIGIWIIPLIVLIYLATTNAVNLTDGLDGLASSTTLCYSFTMMILLLVLKENVFAFKSEVFNAELSNLIKLASVLAGSMLAFMVFNCFPAKIFMGDTGSLALGSLVASVAVFSKTSLYIPIIGVMFVASAVSVIVQVAYYKLTKKRIFLMAPLHHHFEKKGVHEVRITLCYALVTLFAGLVCVLINIL